MKVKTKRVFTAFLLFALAFCSRPQNPDGKVVTPPNSSEKVNSIAILMPNIGDINESLDKKRTISDTEIESDFKKISDTLFSDSSKSYSGMTKTDFGDYVFDQITRSSELSAILEKFEQNGVYFTINSSEHKEESKYGTPAHIQLTQTGPFQIMKKILQTYSYDDLWSEFLNQIETGPSPNPEITDTITKFALQVAREDDEDAVFGLDQQFTIDFGILGEETLPRDQTKEAITLSHFWDPDKGWNAGNTNIWPYLFQVFKKKIQEKTDDWVEVDNELTQLLIKRTRPEYGVALLKNPPSAYYKALCYWYGWKKLRYTNHTQTQAINNPGIIELVRTNPQQAAIYLARVIHLLEDMTVPSHAHNDPHGKDGMGGEDAWENGISRNFAVNVIPNETYHFQIENNMVSNFKKFISKNAAQYGNGYFEDKMENIEQTYSNLKGLWPLFFNTAQATQLFPAFKANMVKSRTGNNLIANGNYYLNSVPSLSTTANYNDTENYFQYNPFTQYRLDEYMVDASNLQKEYPLTEKGTYYLVYVGSEDIQNVTISDELLEIVNGKIRIKDNNPDFRLYFIGYPFNMMAENLMPLVGASTVQLLRMYRWLY